MSIRLGVGVLLACMVTVALAWLAVARPFAAHPPHVVRSVSRIVGGVSVAMRSMVRGSMFGT